MTISLLRKYFCYYKKEAYSGLASLLVVMAFGSHFKNAAKTDSSR